MFNAIERLPGGRPVYDGYVPGGAIGPSNIDFGLTPAGALPPGDPRNRMQPRDSPVIQINTETEEALLGASTGLAYRRPDSDAQNDRYRLWEVPGASHVSNDLNSSPITEQRDLAELEGIPLAALPAAGCTHQQFVNGPWVGVPGSTAPNTYPFSNVANAAFADLTKWVDDGIPPPRAARIEVTNTRLGTVARDRFGNALGGLRTPFLDVPTATYAPTDAVAQDTEISGLCVLVGYNTQFSHATLQLPLPHSRRLRREGGKGEQRSCEAGVLACVRCPAGRATGRRSRHPLGASARSGRRGARGPERMRAPRRSRREPRFELLAPGDDARAAAERA